MTTIISKWKPFFSLLLRKYQRLRPGPTSVVDDGDDYDDGEIKTVLTVYNCVLCQYWDFHQRLLHLKKAVLPILSNQDVAVLIVSLELWLEAIDWKCFSVFLVSI